MQREVDQDRMAITDGISRPTADARAVLELALREAFEQLKVLQAMYPQVTFGSLARPSSTCQPCAIPTVPRTACHRAHADSLAAYSSRDVAQRVWMHPRRLSPKASLGPTGAAFQAQVAWSPAPRAEPRQPPHGARTPSFRTMERRPLPPTLAWKTACLSMRRSVSRALHPRSTTVAMWPSRSPLCGPTPRLSSRGAPPLCGASDYNPASRQLAPTYQVRLSGSTPQWTAGPLHHPSHRSPHHALRHPCNNSPSHHHTRHRQPHHHRCSISTGAPLASPRRVPPPLVPCSRRLALLPPSPPCRPACLPPAWTAWRCLCRTPAPCASPPRCGGCSSRAAGWRQGAARRLRLGRRRRRRGARVLAVAVALVAVQLRTARPQGLVAAGQRSAMAVMSGWSCEWATRSASRGQAGCWCSTHAGSWHRVGRVGGRRVQRAEGKGVQRDSRSEAGVPPRGRSYSRSLVALCVMSRSEGRTPVQGWRVVVVRWWCRSAQVV